LDTLTAGIDHGRTLLVGIGADTPLLAAFAAITAPREAFVVQGRQAMQLARDGILVSSGKVDAVSAAQAAFDSRFDDLQTQIHRLGGRVDKLSTAAGRTAERRLLVLSFVGIAVVCGLAFLIIRRIVRPVGEVAAALIRLADGDLTDRVTVRGQDEI